MEPSIKRSRGSINYVWSNAKIHELIALYESHTDLWDVSTELYSNRAHKQKLQAEIATTLEIDVEDVASKVHNLRCQYNAEMRKLKKKKKSGFGSDEVYVPRWEYFNSLKFLTNGSQSSNTTSNLAINDNDEKKLPLSDDTGNGNELTYSSVATVSHSSSFRKKKANLIPSQQKKKKKKKKSKEELMNSAMKILSKSADSHQIFGDYVADQMRCMSEGKCKRLKLCIQRTIVEIEDEPDESIPHMPSTTSTPSTSSSPFPQANEQYSKLFFKNLNKSL